MKVRCKYCQHEFNAKELEHCPRCNKKFRINKLEPKTKFYEKRGR